MLWTIISFKKPKSQIEAIVAKVKQAHRDYIKSKVDMIFCAAPMQNDEGADNTGCLWIIKANSRAEAKAFSDAEPYTKSGVFASVIITRLRAGHMHLYPELAGKECVEHLENRKSMAQ